MTRFPRLRFSLLSAALLLGLSATRPAAAQALPAASAEPTTAADPLRVIITPLADSPTLRVRYESASYGAVRLRIRDEQGRVLYDEVKRQSRFAGDLVLQAWPAGTYTVELSTPAARRTQTVRLSGGRTQAVASLLAAK